MSLPRKYMVEKRVCGTCVHYRQHYVRTEQGNYYPLWYGHCIPVSYTHLTLPTIA